MTTIEAIYKKAHALDGLRLQELNDFLDFLLQKKKLDPVLFPATELEAPDDISPYTGKSLSLDEMDDAIHFEAEKRS